MTPLDRRRAGLAGFVAVALAVRVGLALDHYRTGLLDGTTEGLMLQLGRDFPGTSLRQGPVYPALIAASLWATGTWLPVLLLQSVVSVAVAAGLARLVAERGLVVPARLLLVGLLFSPLALIYDRLLMAESLATSGLILAVCMIWRGGRAPRWERLVDGGSPYG